uniref:Glabrous enhancer-binding protein-like DBD domain-containing protein n=1 Tax=Noccaea caerulescens TaxID=107243 RepID=A0A1J3JLD1_NOCCA
MVVKRRLRHGGDSSVTKSDCLGIRNNGQPLPLSPLRRMHDDEVSDMEAMLRRAKQQKTTTAKTPMSSSVSKMNWTRNDELIILASIVDYEKDTKLSYQSDWDAFYGYIIGSIEANFSKKQLKDKIRNLVKRFTDNQANRKILSFSTEDDEIFKLSMLIWGTNETECENVDQDKVLDNKDVPCAEREHEPLDENMDQEKDATYAEPERVDEMVDQEKDLNVPSVEHERVDENMDEDKIEDERVNENVDQEKDHVRETEHEPVSNISMEIGKGEKEKSEEDGVLQDALEALTLFQSLGKCQQNMMLQNLKNLGEQKRRELSDEWKALFYEEMKLKIKILGFSAKLANAGVSD